VRVRLRGPRGASVRQPLRRGRGASSAPRARCGLRDERAAGRATRSSTSLSFPGATRVVAGGRWARRPWSARCGRVEESSAVREGRARSRRVSRRSRLGGCRSSWP